MVDEWVRVGIEEDGEVMEGEKVRCMICSRDASDCRGDIDSHTSCGAGTRLAVRGTRKVGGVCLQRLHANE